MNRIILLSWLVGMISLTLCSSPPVAKPLELSQDLISLSKEIQDVQLTEEDVDKYLPIVLQSLATGAPLIPNANNSHQRNKRALLLKKKLIIAKLLLLKKLAILGVFKGPQKGSQGGYGYGPSVPSKYGPPQTSSYGPPPQSSYGPPPAVSYGPPPSGYDGR